MATKTTKTTDGRQEQERYLVVTEVREYGYFHLKGRIAGQKYDQSQWLPESLEDYYGRGPLWSGLRVSCQGDERTQTRTDQGQSGPVYSWHVTYEEYQLSIGLDV